MFWCNLLAPFSDRSEILNSHLHLSHCFTVSKFITSPYDTEISTVRQYDKKQTMKCTDKIFVITGNGSLQLGHTSVEQLQNGIYLPSLFHEFVKAELF